LVFNSDPVGDNQGTVLFVIGANGKNFKRLTDNTARNLAPSWSPVLDNETLQIFDQQAQNPAAPAATTAPAEPAVSAPPADAQTVKIVVAQEVLPMGTRIEQDDVLLCDWPINWTSQYAITATNDVIGLMARTTIPAGTPVLITAAVDESYAANTGLTIKPSPKGAKVACPQDFTQGVQVVVVAQDLPKGITIPDVGLKMATYPKQVVPTNAFTNIGQVLGKKACLDLYRDNIILKSQIGGCAQ
jgi:Flp pilus assembly protein CpaB